MIARRRHRTSGTNRQCLNLTVSNRSLHSSFSTNPFKLGCPAAPPRAGGQLDSLFSLAETSCSLIASRHSVEQVGEVCEISSFLLLGERGGGRPIRVALFAGLEPEDGPIADALAALLARLTRRPALARDFALLAYPTLDPWGSGLEERYAADQPDPDVQFFQREFQRWDFDGLICLRSAPSRAGLHAAVESQLLATEIVQPALEAAAKSLPLATRPLRSPFRQKPLAGLHASSAQRPRPFEIDLFIPRSAAPDAMAAGVFTAITEILRHYRVFISHAQDI
jgi:hypothetical protein